MIDNFNRTFEKDTKMFNSFSKIKVSCKCSHTIVMIASDRVICSHCGNWVYKDKKTEFKYKIAEKMKQMERNDNDEHTV